MSPLEQFAYHLGQATATLALLGAGLWIAVLIDARIRHLRSRHKPARWLGDVRPVEKLGRDPLEDLFEMPAREPSR